MLSIEPRGRSGGGGSSSPINTAPVSEPADSVTASLEIDFVPSNGKGIPASSMKTPDRRRQPQMIGGYEYPAPASFDDVYPGRLQLIDTISWFSRAAVFSNDNSGFVSIA